MLTHWMFLAASGLETPEHEAMKEAARKGGNNGLFSNETGLVLGAILLLAAIIFFWDLLPQAPETFARLARPGARQKTFQGIRRILGRPQTEEASPGASR